VSEPNPTPAPQPNPAPAAGERPDWAPEKFWDPEAKTVRIEDLAKSYGVLEGAVGRKREEWEADRLKNRPEAPDKYALPTLEGVDPEFVEKHPLLPAVREIAHANGLDQKGFEELGAKVINALRAAAPDPAKEMAALGENAAPRIAALEAWVGKTFTDPAENDAVSLIAATAAGVRALEKLAAIAEGKPLEHLPGTGTDTAKPGKTIADIRKMMDSEAYWNPMKRDPALVKEVEDWFKANP
jgi:hypothetical protein